MSNCGVVLVNCFPDDKEMYLEYFRYAGYDPVHVCDVREAFQAVVRLRPKVVVTDTVLPGGDGLGFIRQLRRDPRTQDVTIVVVTGRAFEADRIAAQRAGCDVFLRKPCLPQTLVKEVDAACAA